MRDAFDSATGHPLSQEERTTKLGLKLRKYKIDELPQFWNIVKGDMSLVGPRPYTPGNPVANDKKRQEVKPGITGLQQVFGGNNLTYEERLKLDHRYVDIRNLMTDLGICFATVGAIIRQRNEKHYGSDQDPPSPSND